MLCTYLLAFFSVQQLRDAMGFRIWRTFRLIALEYIALVFADDFILAPLQATGFRSYPLSYLPFAVMLVAGVGLRLAAFVFFIVRFLSNPVGKGKSAEGSHGSEWHMADEK